MVVNILVNPNIRWLIVTGHENQHFSGKAVINLVKYGIDSKVRRILNRPEAKTSYLPNISIDAIERFRKQVKVLDLLLPDKELENSVDELQTIKIGTREFKLPIKISEHGNERIFKLNRLNQKVLPEILSFIIHACIQEHENKVLAEIDGKYYSETYELFDIGAFDIKPYVVKLFGVEHYYEVHVPYLDKDCGLIVANSISDEYNYLVKAIKERGRYTDTHYGPTHELLFTHTVILNSEKLEPISQAYPPRDLEDIMNYCKALVQGESPLDTKELPPQIREAYSYGQRIRKWGEELKNYILLNEEFNKFIEEQSKLGINKDKLRSLIEAFIDKFLIIDQLEAVIAHLVNDLSSRQAIISLWNPAFDLRLNKSPPCFTTIQFFIRDNELHAMLYIRSHDFQNAHIHNIAAVRELMIYVLNKLKRTRPNVFEGLQLGKLHFIVGSNHIYHAHIYR